MNATEITATLSVRAADVCRRYLPHGRKQGRYWTVGDTNGAKGRSLFVRLTPPGIPEKWTGAATNKHGYLLDLIRLRTGGGSLRRAMEEAIAFLSLPPSTSANGGAAEGVQRSWFDLKRPAKANLARPRKALGRVHGRAVRFGGSASGATLLAGEGIETVLSLVTAVPGIHAAAALSAGSLGAFEAPQDLPLLVIARDKDVEGRHAANRLQRRCVKRGIPSIMIAPERSDFNDDLIAFGQETLAARIAPLIASIKPGGTVEERRGSGRIITPS